MRRSGSGFPEEVVASSKAAPVVRLLAKTALTLVTLVFLASIGGAMVFAFPVLVLLHWWATRRSGPAGATWWALLAGLSLAEVAAIAALTVAGDGWQVAVALVVPLVATVAVFVRWGTRRAHAA